MKTQISASAMDQDLAQRAILAQGISRPDAMQHPPMGSVQNFSQDREIFTEGEPAECFYKVVSGVVRTCKFLVDGRRQIDAFYVPGDIFGLEAGTEHRLSAEAVCDCTVIAYRKTTWDRIADHHRELSKELLDFAMAGMAKAQEHSLLLSRRSAVEKVVGFLIAWAEKSKDGEMVSLAMTRQDIADYLGLTIETVSRTLSQLERDHVIELPSVRQIHLCNLDRLEDLAA